MKSEGKERGRKTYLQVLVRHPIPNQMPLSREYSEHAGKLCRRGIALHQSLLFAIIIIVYRCDAALRRYDSRQRHGLLLERSIGEFLQQEVEAGVQHFAHHGGGVGRVY